MWNSGKRVSGGNTSNRSNFKWLSEITFIRQWGFRCEIAIKATRKVFFIVLEQFGKYDSSGDDLPVS
jgi:hypothetical protein